MCVEISKSVFEKLRSFLKAAELKYTETFTEEKVKLEFSDLSETQKKNISDLVSWLDSPAHS